MSKYKFVKKIHKLEREIVEDIKHEIKRIGRQITFSDFSRDTRDYLKRMFEYSDAFYIDHYNNLMLAPNTHMYTSDNFESYLEDCEFSTKILSHIYDELTEVNKWQHQRFEMVYNSDGESRFFTVNDLRPLLEWNEEFANKINTDRFYLNGDGLLNVIEEKMLIDGHKSCVFFYVRGPHAVVAFIEGRLFATTIKVKQVKVADF